MAATLATLYAFGGAAGLVMTLDLEPGPTRYALTLMCGISLAAALAVRRWGARWPRDAFHWAVAAATVVIGCAVLAAPDPVTSLGAASVMVFVVVDAHFFFPARQALAHLGAAVVGVTGALLLSGGVGLGVALGLDVVLVGIGVVIHRLVLLASSASRDPLTGLLNRRGFDQALHEQMARAARTGRPLTAVLIDVDHFKAVNDTFGHEGGDRVLCRVADTWRREVPGGAVLARHGGDEFSLLLPGMRAAAALALVRRVCAADPDISLSCGVAQYRAGDSASQLMRSADRALYDAKILGRGRAELVSDSPRADGAPLQRQL
jgi:diguanylate cyclase (GGDEF)-like protein